MKKIIFGLILVVVLVMSGCSVAAVETPPSATPTPTPETPVTTAAPTATPTPEPTTETAAPTTETAPATTETETTPTTEAPPPPPPGGGDFVIVQRETEARYDIAESFEDEYVTVYGTSSEVSGSFSVSYADPAAAVMGPIEIVANSFKGQGRFARSLRDSNINLLILHTFKYPTITFTPTSLEGLPAQFTVGDEVNFKIIGDLTIRDTTSQATFDVTLNVVSEDRLEGVGVATVLRSTYSLIYFNIPREVKDIADEFTLTLNFVAETE